MLDRVLDRLAAVRGQQEDDQEVRSRGVGDQRFLVRSVEGPRDVVGMFHVVPACRFELEIQLGLGEVAGSDASGSAEGGVEAAVILRPIAHGVAALRGDRVEVGLADLFLLLLGGHRGGPWCGLATIA